MKKCCEWLTLISYDEQEIDVEINQTYLIKLNL